MKVVVSGATGLVGSRLVAALKRSGATVTRLVRRTPAAAGDVSWDPSTAEVDAPGLEGHDAVVHLAGESIAGRWTKAKKARIGSSRIDGTRVLVEALRGLSRPPAVLVSASAIGIYGNRGSERLNEQSPSGRGFLAGVCTAWEAEALKAATAGLRVVVLRLGVVLSPDGGALAQMLPPFKLGAGGPIGSGSQYVSWISIDDVVAAIEHVLATPELSGPVNAVSPVAVTNAELARTLGRVLGRPAAVKIPAFAARLAFGEAADELLLASTWVEPARLLATGFDFSHPELEGALRHVLGR